MKKTEGQENERDKSREMEAWEDEPEVWIDYFWVECGTIDPVPEFIVAECSDGLEDGESQELFVQFVMEPW
ncbi:hypothetical protein A3842_04035 [Paenibacillus sp. P3E]|uniref:hypothetical protein n=1 Tax=Paenibacillus sp. P3E TaxID=1349435 RepID=UPI00093EDC28|nr:hypothetical protein [Paenibacillus sp. P3E]OKP89663.1 hypothetical protein A3842_04035 [Paenibacillus sp. P3E]